jgi:hypothetical protein
MKTIETKWKDLYKIGGISFILTTALVLFAIIAYFIWPYSPNEKSTVEILSILAKDKIGGLISLDFIMLITLIIYIFPILALYASLKTVNESYALIALTFGLLAVATVITSRPLVEMSLISDKFNDATSEIVKNRYLSSAESFRLMFDGTAWVLQTFFLLTSGLISSSLMLKSEMFNNKIAWIGIISSLIGLCFWIPKIGIALLFLNTILTIVWCPLVARVFIKHGWNR